MINRHLVIGVLVVFGIIVSVETHFAWEEESLQSIRVANARDRAEYSVKIPDHWQRSSDDASSYQNWLYRDRPSLLDRLKRSKETEKPNAKYSFGILDNSDGLSVGEWLARYGKDEMLTRAKVSGIEVNNLKGHKYQYASTSEENPGTYLVIYAPIDQTIIYAAVFSTDNRPNLHEARLERIIRSLSKNNKS